MDFIKITFFGLVALCLIVLTSMAFSAFSLTGSSEECRMLRGGTLECDFGGTLFSSLSHWNYKDCMVDDNYEAHCIHERIQRVRIFGDTGWPTAAPNCAAWMTYNGCDPSDCFFVNDGSCEGDVSALTAECDIDSDCRDGQYCNAYAQCMDQVSSCDWRYRCEHGVVSGCTEARGIYVTGTGCYFSTGVSECKRGVSTVVGATISDVCGDSATPEQCTDNQVYVDGICVTARTEEEKETVAKKYTEFTSKLDKLKEAEQACKASGKIWTGTDCVTPEGPSGLPEEGAECEEDYIVECYNGEEITYAECVDGYYKLTTQECEWVPKQLYDVTPPRIDDDLSFFDKYLVHLYILGGLFFALIVVGGYSVADRKGWLS